MADTKAAGTTRTLQLRTYKHNTVVCHVHKDSNPSLRLPLFATAHSQTISIAAVELPRSNCGPVQNSESNGRVSPVEMAPGMGVMRVVSGQGGCSVKINSPWHRKRLPLVLREVHVSAQHQVVGLDSTDRHHLYERGEKKILSEGRGGHRGLVLAC